MSQTACFLTIEDVLVEEIFPSIIDKNFDRDTMTIYVQETVEVEPDRDYDCEMVHYEIGEGESGTDHFFDDGDLISWYKEGGLDLIEKKVKEQGYEMELIQSETYCIFDHELECENADFEMD